MPKPTGFILGFLFVLSITGIIIEVIVGSGDNRYSNYNDLTELCGYKAYAQDLSMMLSIVEQKQDKKIAFKFEESCINSRHQPNKSLIYFIKDIKKHKKTFKEDEEAQETFVTLIDEMYENDKGYLTQKNKVQELKGLDKEFEEYYINSRHKQNQSSIYLIDELEQEKKIFVK